MPIIYAQYLYWYWYLKVMYWYWYWYLKVKYWYLYWYLDYWYWYWYWYLFVEYLIQDCLLLRVLRLKRYERISTENRHFRSNGVSLTHNFREKGSPHQPFFLPQD